ncbi:MAG TPA: type IX secretion system membrane protein PorP/SprF [Salinimicrobium sp.]|nr:type IX secretion system membrane protein PorP/SprF [Salinimicrobium sp.]
MNLKTPLIALAIILFSFTVKAQEGIPTYSDYITDNLYLLHPSMAGAANANQIRLTARQQWFDVEDAPSLQTLSVNGRFGEKTGLGLILFNDSNGNFSQSGVFLSFAYHLMFSRSVHDLNQLSFGISAGFIQGKLDDSAFGPDWEGDPANLGITSDTYYNVDVGLSYNFLDFYSHFTVKNILPQEREMFTEELESNNQRRYILSAGYVFGGIDSDWSYEPSLMFQLTDETAEKSLDGNFKVYREMDFGTLWGGISYRRSFDGAEYLDGNEVQNQQLQYITPFLGLNYSNFIFGYTYSYQANSIVFGNSGFHQITLGYDFGGTGEPYDCNCPSVN